MFRPEFDPLLKFLDDDGQSVQPWYYIPTIAAVLLNSQNGIALGYKTDVPAHNILDLIRIYVVRLMATDCPFTSDLGVNENEKQYILKFEEWLHTTDQGKAHVINCIAKFADLFSPNQQDSGATIVKPTLWSSQHTSLTYSCSDLLPYYRDFKGTIELDSQKKNVVISGIVKKIDDQHVEITELPVGVWITNMKQKLIDMRDGVKKSKKTQKEVKFEPKIVEFREAHVDRNVKFIIKLNPKQMEKASKNFFDYFGTITNTADDDDGENQDDDKENNNQETINQENNNQDINNQENNNQKINKNQDRNKADNQEKTTNSNSSKNKGSKKNKKNKPQKKPIKLEEDVDNTKLGGLRKRISLERFILFDANEKLKHYKSIQEIIEDHFIECLKYYKQLKQMLVKNLTETVYEVSEKVRFIRLCCERKIDLTPPIKSKDLEAKLTSFGFQPFLNFNTIEEGKEANEQEEQDISDKAVKPQKLKNSKKVAKKPIENKNNSNNMEIVDEKNEEEKETNKNEEKLNKTSKKPFHYLRKLPLDQLTEEDIAMLTNLLDGMNKQLQELKSTHPHQIWLKHLQELYIGYQSYEQERQRVWATNNALCENSSSSTTTGKRKNNKNKAIINTSSVNSDNSNTKKKRKLTDDSSKKDDNKKKNIISIL